MTISQTVIFLLAIAIGSLPLSYVLGFLFSQGYHRAKRQYVNRMITDSILDVKE